MQQGVVSNWGTAFFVLFLLIPCVSLFLLLSNIVFKYRNHSHILEIHYQLYGYYK